MWKMLNIEHFSLFLKHGPKFAPCWPYALDFLGILHTHISQLSYHKISTSSTFNAILYKASLNFLLKKWKFGAKSEENKNLRPTEPEFGRISRFSFGICYRNCSICSLEHVCVKQLSIENLQFFMIFENKLQNSI